MTNSEGLRALAERERGGEAAELQGHSASSLTSQLGNKDCRSDPSKLRFDLIAPEMEEALAKVLTYGANKPAYGPRNWEKGIPFSELYAATRRHLFAWFNGDTMDESGMPHLWHAFCDIGMLLTMDQRRPDLDDLRRKT